MLCQDPGYPPSSPLSTLGVGGTGTGWKLLADTAYADGSNGNSDSVSGWCATDDWQRIDWQFGSGGGGTRAAWIYVLGYEEFTDVASGEFTF